ncbi:hypothetical protein ACHAWC_010106 [Mediolabrus comicus]
MNGGGAESSSTSPQQEEKSSSSNDVVTANVNPLDVMMKAAEKRINEEDNNDMHEPKLEGEDDNNNNTDHNNNTDDAKEEKEGEEDQSSNNNGNNVDEGGDVVMEEKEDDGGEDNDNNNDGGGDDNNMGDASSAAEKSTNASTSGVEDSTKDNDEDVDVASSNLSEGGGGDNDDNNDDDDVMGEASTSADATEKVDDKSHDERQQSNGGEGGDDKKETNTDVVAAATEGSDSKPTENTTAEQTPNLPLLVGTLSYVDKDSLRRHVIRGNWKYEHLSEATAPQRFELIRNIPAEEDVTQLPKDGEFHGSFSLQYKFTTSKGKVKLKSRTVPESGVKLTFKGGEKEGEEEFAVNGTGTNEYGVFELFGTATKSPTPPGEEDVREYKVKIRKKYISLAVPPALEKSSKDKKRKLGDSVESSDAEPQELPPPTELHPTGVICLRGKLVRNTSADLSLDNTVVHRISGVWAMGLDKILADPDNKNGECNKFEYEHKCSGDSTVFPLSGRYTGSFYVNADANSKTKVAERDVVLKFRENNAGFHNVDGKGSNYFGKYTITGTLDKEGVITIFRHFQVPKIKAKASKKSAAAQIKVSTPEPAPLNGASSASVASSVGGPALISLDDVKAPPSGSRPVAIDAPKEYAAVMRGILKIEADGTHTCSGNWAVTNDHFSSGLTSKYHFGIEGHRAADDAKVMLQRLKDSGADKDDDRELKGVTGDGVTPISLANTTFPIDSSLYKGTFKLRKGATKTQTIMDKQIAMKFVKNDSGSYNVYGRGINEFGEFDLVGTLILQGKANGLMQVYRIYELPPQPAVVQPAAKKGGKVFPGGMTEKAGNSGPVPAMKPAERFTPSMSGLQRRESSGRMVKLPSRLEEDDPQAVMDRLMEQCRQILLELKEKDVHKIFAAPVDPVALNIPNYLEIIKEPMDLGTIENRMNVNVIDSPQEFARLVRLTFTNAIKYNSLPDNPVHRAARDMLTIFTSRFGTIDKAFEAAKKNKKLTKAERQELKRKEKEAAKEAKKKAKEEKERKRKAAEDAANASKRLKIESFVSANKAAMEAIKGAADSSAKVTRNEFNLLLEMVQRMQDHVVGLHKLVNKSGGKSHSSTSSKKSQEKSVSSTTLVDAPMYLEDETHADDPYDSDYGESAKPKKKKAKKEPQAQPVQVQVAAQPLSFEEQEALSDAINELPERLLLGAMQIIREADVVNDDDEEIDLDIDQLDSRTQRRLQKFVMENVKQKKKKRGRQPKASQSAPVPAPQPVPVSNEPTNASKQRPPGGKSFFSLGEDDSDSDDDGEQANTTSDGALASLDDKEEEDAAADDFGTNWGANLSQDAAKDDADHESDNDDGLWGEARKQAEVSKAREADRAKREEKIRAEAEMASKKRMEEAAALGEQARAKREEEEAEAARLLEEKEREAEEAKHAAREKALQEVNDVQNTVDLDAQRELMKQYEQEYDNYSGGASPASDFGF